MIKAFNNIFGKINDTSDNTIAGIKIVKQACYAPFKKIMDNAGKDNWYEILHMIFEDDKEGNNFTTFNVKTDTIADALTEGLLDPVKVTRIALENAASVAGTILTTESVVFEKKDEKNDNGGMNLGM